LDSSEYSVSLANDYGCRGCWATGEFVTGSVRPFRYSPSRDSYRICLAQSPRSQCFCLTLSVKLAVAEKCPLIGSLFAQELYGISSLLLPMPEYCDLQSRFCLQTETVLAIPYLN